MLNREYSRALVPDKPPDKFEYIHAAPFAARPDRLPLFDMGPTLVMQDPFDPYVERLYPNPYHNALSRIGSFRQYLMGHFYESYVEYLTMLIESGRLPLGKQSAAVPSPDRFSVRQADVQRIDLYRKSSDEVYADIIMSVDVAVSQNRAGAVVADRLTQWFRVRTSSALAPGECSFNNLICIMVYDRDEPAPGCPLDEYLVPYTRAGMLDSEGQDLLATFYPEALAAPCRIDGERLAARMKLDVRYYKLTLDCAIRGQMYFETRDITVLSKSGKPMRVTIPANTIVIDLSTCSNEDGGINKEKLNDTVIHECYHAYKHRLFYLGQRLYNDDLRCLSCSVSGERAGLVIDAGLELCGSRNPDEAIMGEASFRCRSPIEWIEWQANRVTPRIRMPSHTTRDKIEELMRTYRSRCPNMARPKLIASVINDLAAFFGVSKQSAKIRMIELGYPEAQGVLNFANGAYVENHAFTPGSLEKDETFTISFSDALDLYARNPEFQRRIDSGLYQYIDGHFCRASSRYVYRRNDELRLTSYAKSHMDECCLIFSVRSFGPDYLYRAGTLLREASETKRAADFHDPDTGAADLLAESIRLANIINDLPMSPAKTLKEHMKREHITVEALVAKSGVSERTISRLRNEDELYTPSKESAIAICIGLHLEPLLSRDWMTKAGTPLTTSKTDVLYELLLRSMYMQPVSAVNSRLREYGLPPLCKGEGELDA